ncbi:Disease resistance protein RFL1 [Camellia lanceoleosa]|uniref:Disease resistance protein RFL1 n=1 Tax=Camellia lanceoleosa TaxID=1840588 RepID=A0ACC0FGW1_9ERIC|nr:Disease resistance protein RFL1 [Camellia lanceoleosa]
MQFLHSIFEIGKSTWEETQKRVGYINFLDANMKNLKQKTEYLSSQENDRNKEVSIAEQRSRKRRKKEVEVWQKDVQRIKGDVQTLQIQEQEIVGWKNVFLQVRLGKLVVEKIKEVAEVQEKCRFSCNLLINAFPNSAQFIPTTRSLGEITSARNMEKIWEYLMDDEVRRIGIYGMGGVGKTTIMHHINNRLLNETCNFSDVIWVTVSKAFTVTNL